MLERRGVISGYEGSKPRQVLVTEADLPRVLAALESPRPAQPVARACRAATSLSATRDARDRRDAARGADARAHRRVRDRGADEDPGEVPAGAGERRVGPAARAHVREELPAHLRRRRWDSTARRWWRNTGCSYERPSEPTLEPIVSSPRKARVPRGSGGARRAPRAATWRSWAIVGVVIVLLIVGLLSRRRLGGSTPRHERAHAMRPRNARATHGARRTARARPPRNAAARRCALSLRADRRRVRVPDRRRRAAS